MAGVVQVLFLQLYYQSSRKVLLLYVHFVRTKSLSHYPAIQLCDYIMTIPVCEFDVQEFLEARSVILLYFQTGVSREHSD